MRVATVFALAGMAYATDSTDGVKIAEEVKCDGTALGADLFAAGQTAAQCQELCKGSSGDAANTAKVVCCQETFASVDAGATWDLSGCQPVETGAGSEFFSLANAASATEKTQIFFLLAGTY